MKGKLKCLTLVIGLAMSKGAAPKVFLGLAFLREVYCLERKAAPFDFATFGRHY